MGEPAAGARADEQLAVARFGGGQPGHHPMEEVGDRPEGVVVERGHLRAVDRAVRQQAVPPLPHGRRPHRDRVQPRRALRLQQQVVGVVDETGVDQGVAHERRPDEAGADAEVLAAHELGEAGRGPATLRLGRQQVEAQRHGVGGLRVAGHPPGRGHELGVEPVGDAVGELVVARPVGLSSEHAGGAGEQAGGVGVVGGGDQARRPCVRRPGRAVERRGRASRRTGSLRPTRGRPRPAWRSGRPTPACCRTAGAAGRRRRSARRAPTARRRPRPPTPPPGPRRRSVRPTARRPGRCRTRPAPRRGRPATIRSARNSRRGTRRSGRTPAGRRSTRGARRAADSRWARRRSCRACSSARSRGAG